MNDNINDYVPSILNPRCIKKDDFSLTQISIASRSSLSLRRNKLPNKNVISKDTCHKNTTKLKNKKEKPTLDKENLQNTQNVLPESQTVRHVTYTSALSGKSLGFSAIEDFQTNKEESSPFSFGDIGVVKNHEIVKTSCDINNKNQESLISLSSATDLEDGHSDSTILYNTKPVLTVCFGIENCDSVDVTTNKGAIKRFLITRTDTSANVECEVLETSEISTETEGDENMNETSSSPLKRSAIAVNLEIKKRKLSNVTTESSKILILKTNAIEKISHVIVQPPNYKFVKRHLLKSSNKTIDNKNGAGLKQIAIDSFFRKTSHATEIGSDKWEDAEDMSKNSGVTDAVKYLSRSTKQFRGDGSPRSAKLPSKRDATSPRPSEVKTSSPILPPRSGSVTSHSPRKNAESILLNPIKTKSIRSSLSPKFIPHHKIVAGTHFAVDAFSYGEIPNVKHYFLTHFHSDHYSGLKKSFNKFLFCSKITADLCISRLSVNPKHIQIINVDETLRIDGVEVTAVDANHCPGALMLVFTLPNGKSLLHTGDFRACPPMESYPVFWNRDIHTVYLDTTYCNPRYDFPTQDQSLEMALHILRQKKMALEKSDKKFTSVLIVCGTYTIGKEKFFLGMSRRVGCSVWACPEKERVLLTVEGKARSRDPPQSCQLHVVPMRDLTHEKLRSYLDSLQPAFSEVVAFKPSGWENGKTTGVEKDGVTIHGIPYSEHSSFSELIRFVKFLKPKQVVPTVDISGGVKAVQKYFPCPLVYKEEVQAQSRLTDFFSIQHRQSSAVT